MYLNVLGNICESQVLQKLLTEFKYSETMAIITVILLSFVVIFGITFWKTRKSREHKKFLARIPGPKTYPIVGNGLDIRSTADVITAFTNYEKTYGEVVQFWLGCTQVRILLSNYKLVEAILSSTKNLHKNEDYIFLHKWLGQGLITSEPTRWKKHRKILTPAFHFQILEKFVQIFRRPTSILVRQLRKQKNVKILNIYSFVDLCSLDIICETAMGTSVDAQDNGCEYANAVHEMGRIIIERIISPFKQFDIFFRFTKDYYKEKAALKILHGFTDSVIKQRKNEILKLQEISKNTDDSFESKNTTFLDILLSSKVDGEPLCDEVIREEVDTFMLAGHDTSASGTSFVLYCLANHPEVQRKAMDEQTELFGNIKNPNILLNDLQNMKYLEFVIKESLRLYPTVPYIGRHITDDFEVDGELYPKGITYFINVFSIHRSPKHYKDPEKFDPNRFAEMDSKLPFAYIPFSAGSRNCIGQKFAMLEMKYMVSSVLRHFILEPASPNEELILCNDLVLKSKNGINISIRERI